MVAIKADVAALVENLVENQTSLPPPSTCLGLPSLLSGSPQ